MEAYKDWILRTIDETWNLFHKKFTALWDKHKDGSGEAYLLAIYNNPQLQLLVKQKFMKDLFHDTLGFGAAKMIRINLKNIFLYVQEIDEVFLSPLYSPPAAPKLISWCCPTVGKLKLNTDGCLKGNPWQAGYGGLLRDEAGTWIWGYYGKLGHCSSLEAEIWAIYKGLTILFQKGSRDVQIEFDSEQAINQILHGPTQHSPSKALIEDARFLLRRSNSSLGHTLRERNKAVDRLANMGVAQNEHVVFLDNPPIEVTTFLIDDMTGVSFVRD
ncbi:unnamed protein product [Camellia sinensis]